jgi:hypothetical protein
MTRHNPFLQMAKAAAAKSLVILASLLFMALSILFVACTRSTIPLDSTVTAMPQPTEESPDVAIPENGSQFQTSETYTVVWVPAEQTLKLRDPAGIAGSVVDELAYDAHSVRVTANTTSLGSSLWVEIKGPDGEMGWINSWNLTEDVSREDFCTDPRIITLLEHATQAFLEEDAISLAPLVNPKRGLILRHDWWNPEIILRSTEIERIYLSRDARDWGVLRGGDFAITGTFKEIFSPLLKDVLAQTPTAVCGEIPSGVTSIPVEWPGEYANIHFYAFHRPSPNGGNRYNWRTIAFGFEYIQGEPFLALLVNFNGDI